MIKEKNDNSKEKESPEKEEALEKKKERVDQKEGSRPVVPFPQRLQKSKIEEQFARCLKTFQKLKISMPFT